MCLWGEGGEAREDKRGRNQYIFTESPCVAGTETGRKEGGQRKEGKGFREREEVIKDGGKEERKEACKKSCLSVISQFGFTAALQFRNTLYCGVLGLQWFYKLM